MRSKGVQRFSDTIGKRDEQINQLLANANKIAGVLGNRSEQINTLLVNAQTLLAAVNERGQAITYLLERVSAFSEQVKGFINENPNLNHVLEQLRTISDILRERKFDLADTLTTLTKFTASLGEAIASGPYFKVMLVNLVPYQILQPFVDAAFKKRGIDPENFWRGAGLPAYQFPDPNGARFPNGAPPPSPAVVQGTPEYPGSGGSAGSPCAFTPPADGIPTAANPLPCSAPRPEPGTVRSGLQPQQPDRSQRGDVAAEPERSRVHAGHHRAPVCRARLRRICRASRCRCRPRRRVRAPEPVTGPVEPVPAVRRAARPTARGRRRLPGPVRKFRTPRRRACRYPSDIGGR